MELEIEFRQPKIEFGKKEDRNMEGRITLKFGVRTKNDHHYIMYDEFDMLFEADVAIDQEVLVGNIHSFKIEMSEHTDKTRTMPVFDTMDTT